MDERRDGNQSVNLTPDHKKSGIALIYVCASGMQHIIRKLLMRATILLQT
jgi:hypothetical protein